MLHDVIIIIDQPGKRSHINFAGRNGDYGAKFWHSYNFKEMNENLLSCEEFKVKLTKRDYDDLCSDCLNHNFLN